jgi:hypothetical protein
MAEPIRQSYVHDGTEVVKTFKKAERKLKSGKIDQVVEITPKEPQQGTWKKWVREDELFEVLPDEHQ